MTNIFEFEVVINVEGENVTKYYISLTSEEVVECIKHTFYDQQYEIISIEQHIACEGCRHDLLGQDAHDNCPHGCLHDKKQCQICIDYYS